MEKLLILLIISDFLLFANLSPVRAEEKATQPDSVTEWMNCLNEVMDEFNPPVDQCLKKYSNRYWMCEKIANEQKEASDRERKRRCDPILGDKSPSSEQTQNPILPPYAVCAIKCLDDIDQRYQCPLPASVIDDNGVSVIVLPDGSTRNFSPRDNECVDDRGKIQNACLFQCPATVGGEPISDPIDEGEKIKVAGVTSDDPLNEAEKYINLLRRKPDLTRKEEDIKRILGDYEAGKPVSVWDVKGEPEMQVPGSGEWVTLKKGDTIPPGARIFTGMDDDLLVSLPGVYIVKVRSLTDITFSQTGISKALSKGELITHLDLRTGDVEVQVEKGTYQASMQVQMPQAVVGVRGTHFWVSYDEAKRLGVVGVYEGEVAVDDLFRGRRTLLTPAKDKTPRVIVMVPAEANSQLLTQEPTSAPGQKEQAPKTNRNIFISLLFILTAGGIGLYLHKKGKLMPLYKMLSQKVSTLMKKASKNDKEETDKDS